MQSTRRLLRLTLPFGTASPLFALMAGQPPPSPSTAILNHGPQLSQEQYIKPLHRGNLCQGSNHSVLPGFDNGTTYPCNAKDSGDVDEAGAAASPEADPGPAALGNLKLKRFVKNSDIVEVFLFRAQYLIEKLALPCSQKSQDICEVC